MDGFKVVRLEEVAPMIDILITATGEWKGHVMGWWREVWQVGGGGV